MSDTITIIFISFVGLSIILMLAFFIFVIFWTIKNRHDLYIKYCISESI